MNDSIFDFYEITGKNIKEQKYTKLKDNLNSIENIMKTVLIQEVLWYTVYNEALPASDTSTDIGGAYVLANSVFPMLRAADEESAKLVLNNLECKQDTGEYVPDTKEVVASVLATAISKIDGFDCKTVGSISSIGSVCLDSNNETRNDDNVNPSDSTVFVEHNLYIFNKC